MGQTPLQGIKVIEMGTLIAGPFAARLMAEFGAEVIKIESPKNGDPLRQWRRLHNGTSLWWYVQARNKKSVTINLKKEAGQEIVRQLVKDTDTVIENFRPGVMEDWNLGWEQLSAINPRLIMVRISGYGQTGPYRDRPGIWRDRRIHGRLAPSYRLPGSSAGASGGVDRRLHRRHAWRNGRIDGAAPAQHRRRQRSGGRCGTVRIGVQSDGEPAAGVRHVRFHPEQQRCIPAGYYTIKHLSMPGQEVSGNWR